MTIAVEGDPWYRLRAHDGWAFTKTSKSTRYLKKRTRFFLGGFADGMTT